MKRKPRTRHAFSRSGTSRAHLPQPVDVFSLPDRRRALIERVPVLDFLGGEGEVVRARLRSDSLPRHPRVVDHLHAVRVRDVRDVDPRAAPRRHLRERFDRVLSSAFVIDREGFARVVSQDAFDPSGFRRIRVRAPSRSPARQCKDDNRLSRQVPAERRGRSSERRLVYVALASASFAGPEREAGGIAGNRTEGLSARRRDAEEEENEKSNALSRFQARRVSSRRSRRISSPFPTRAASSLSTWRTCAGPRPGLPPRA